MRITVAVPEQHLGKANQLAMALGLSVADEQTYSELSYTDNNDNLYAVASFIASTGIIDSAQNTLTRPLWDEEEAIDMSQAEQAKNLVAFDTAASVDIISAIINDDGLAAIDLMNLTIVVETDLIDETLYN